MRLRTAPVFGLALAASLTARGLAAQATQTAPTIDFSGTMFGNLQVRSDSAAKAQAGGKAPNKFDIERVYLTFRMPAGDRTAIRVTTDIFQNTGGGGYYGGWVVRLKYAYVNRELTKNLFGVKDLGAVGRIGMLHTVVVDHMEVYWPRSLGTVGVERNGFFSSADVGVASLVTLPNHRGEVYVTAVNGSNYTAAETDRFKDIAARASFTPFANGTGLLKSVVITPWYSKGSAASAFVLGGPTQVGPVSEGLQKDRRGVWVAMKDRRLTGAIETAQRVEDVEGGNNTVAVPRTVTSRTSTLTSAFAFVRPAEWMNEDKQSPWGAFARWDKFKLDKSAAAANTFTVLGAFWDVTPRFTLTVDLQQLSPNSASTTVKAKTLFVHWKADY